MQQIGYYCGGRGGLQAKLVVPLHTQAFVSNRTPQDAWHWKPTRRQYPLEKLTCLLFETASVEQKDVRGGKFHAAVFAVEYLDGSVHPVDDAMGNRRMAGLLFCAPAAVDRIGARC